VQALTLYTYCRSSAAYRVRIALNIKALAYQQEYIDLLKAGGEQYSAAYRERNPQMLLPTLCHGEQSISQSLAIIEYLEEIEPDPALLPSAPGDRAVVRALALSIACDIHPLDNLRVLRYLEHPLALDQAARERWYCHWIGEGFRALEARLMTLAGGAGEGTSKYCFGEQPGLADICLIPQVYNALRYNCDMAAYPRLRGIYRHCMGLAAFQEAAPEQQADFVAPPPRPSP